MFFSTATTAQSLVLQKFACFLPSSIFAACLPRDLFVTFVFFRHKDSETCRFFIPVNLASLVEDCGIARLHLCRPGRHRLFMPGYFMCLCRSDSFRLLRLLDPSSCLSCRSDSFRKLRLLSGARSARKLRSCGWTLHLGSPVRCSIGFCSIFFIFFIFFNVYCR